MSAAVASSGDWPTHVRHVDAHVADEAHGVGRRDGGRASVAVTSITLPPGWSLTSAVNSPALTCAATPMTCTAASAGRDRAADRDVVVAGRAAAVGRVELELDARFGRGAWGLAAGAQDEAGGEQDDQAAHSLTG